MSPQGRILLVEDDRENNLMLREALMKRGFEVTAVASGEEGVRAAEAEPFDVVLSDIRLGPVDGLQILRHFKKTQPSTPVILMTGFGSVDTAVEAVRAGAFDYISKPFKLAEVHLLLERALEQRARNLGGAHQKVPHEGSELPRLVGHSRAMAEVYKMIGKLAASRATVLIEGESGTGKELVAQAIHKHSDRSTGPFVAINCAALPETLLESELFGYAPGAHSTATTSKPGVFEQAAGGVLFLDEVGDMTLKLQSKLLRVLESSETRPIGGTRSIQVDVRVLAATNQQLDEAVAAGRFRADLLYRLKVVTLRLPPLRDRKEDLPVLVQHFLEKYGRIARKPAFEIAPEVLDAFQRYDWPGNVRELENVVERAVTLASRSRLQLDDLPPDLLSRKRGGQVWSLAETEKRHILAVVHQTRGNIKAASELLGIDRKTLYRKLAEYDYQVSQDRDDR